MQDYVRGRLAGTVAPPQPTPDPMQSYVLAQGALGSRVPPTTMMDSPQFLEEPGVEPLPAPKSSKYLTEDDRQAASAALIQQMREVSKQIDLVPPGPDRQALVQRWSDLGTQWDQLTKQFNEGPIGQGAQRMMDRVQNRPLDANTMQDAIQNRQAQPRQPLPPPAPGGVPYAPAPQPVIPQPPATAGLTS
jgi:hypothetical protein